MDTSSPQDLAAFVQNIGTRLRRALIAGYGIEVGAAAAATALAYAEANAPRVLSMDDPAHYVWRMGRRKARRYRRRPLRLPEVPAESAPWIEPAVPKALRGLSRRQRVAVMMCHGFGYGAEEVARLVGVAPASVRAAADQGLAKLNSILEAHEDRKMRGIRDQIAAYAEMLEQSASGHEGLAAPAPTVAGIRFGPLVAAVGAGVLLIAGAIALFDDAGTPPRPAVDSRETVPATPLAPVSVRLVNRGAVTPEMFAGWDHRFAGPGAVAVSDGSFHMLSAAYDDGLATVAYAVSPDGVVWNQGADRPVLDLSEAPWAPRDLDEAFPRSLIIDAAGNWQLFFEISGFDRGTNKLWSQIGRAVARDPAGEWRYDEQPIIRPDAEFPWMRDRVSSPSVIAAADGLVMVFVATGAAGRGVIGLAQSVDGSSWDLRPGPVFSAFEDWTQDSLSRVDLIAVPGGFTMVYAGDTPSARGVAVSRGGLEWAPHPDNPLLTAATLGTAVADPGASVFDSEFVRDGPAVMAYIEVGRTHRESEVALLRLELDLESLLAPLLGG